MITRGVRLKLKPERDGSTTVMEATAGRPRNRNADRDRLRACPARRRQRAVLGERSHRLAQGTSYPGQSSPYWYDAPQFLELLSAGEDASVRALIASLDGCAGERAGEIVAAAGLSRVLCRDVDREQALRLLEAARDASKPVNPKRPGAVGPDASEILLRNLLRRSDVRRGATRPHPARRRSLGLPARKERHCGQRQPHSNRGAIVDDARQERHQRVRLRAFALATAPKGTNFAVRLNITTPYMPITSDGKDPDLLPFFKPIADAIQKAIRKVRRPAASGASQKNVVLDNLDDVIDTVSGGEKQYRFNARQLFYALRPIVMTETGQELKIGNFTSIITDYEAENGEIPLMYREPRGSITTRTRARRSRSAP